MYTPAYSTFPYIKWYSLHVHADIMINGHLNLANLKYFWIQISRVWAAVSIVKKDNCYFKENTQ